MSIRDLVPKFGRGRENMPVRRGGYDPFRDFQREMNRLFDDFFTDFPLALHQNKYGAGQAPRWGERELPSAAFTPLVDVTETDKEVKISAELPGIDRKDIDISISRNVLTIRGEKKDERETKRKNYTYAERSYGSFERSISLP